MTVAEQPIKDLLFKEAKKKREHRIRAEQNDILFVEASERIQDKGPKPMARQSGGSTLKNSGWNTDWDFVDPAPDIERIKNEVLQKAMQFFQSMQSGGQSSQSDLRPNPLSFTFRYIRTIVPDNNDEANQKAMNALEILEQHLPGFRQFQQDIEHSNIPLSPYFMTSNFSKQNGRVTPNELQGFLQQEAGRQLQLPDQRQIPTASHYTKHKDMISKGESVSVSDYPNVFRIYSMSEVDNIPSSSWLTQAIDDKIDSGYRINYTKLKQYMKQLYQQKIQENGLVAQSPEAQTYNSHYKSLSQEILQWQKDRESVDLTSFALRIVLKNLQYTGGGIPEVAPDEFRIKKATTPYYSNGWDSSVDDPNKSMPTIPPLRQLPKGEVVYDRGNGNMGYDHLVLNWKGGLDKVLTQWGAKADEWMRMLQQGEAMQMIAQQSPEVFEAWQNVLSMQTGNRTGAEALVDMLNKYPDWNQFNQNHLQKSLASEIRTVNALLKEGWNGQSQFAGQTTAQIIERISQAAQTDPTIASQILKAASSEIVHYYKNGKKGRDGKPLDWDKMTLMLASLNMAHHRNPGVESNGITRPRATERQSMIDQSGFNLLKQYGYQVGKMMDFLYAVMTRCCHEKINTRWNGAEENFFGHQYSTSSGKSAGGDIMLNIAYDQLQATAGTQEVEVVEKIRFTLGQRTGLHDPIILRSSLPWQQMVNAFSEMYPEAGYQLSEINEPINRNLEMLEIAVKEALNEARNNIPVKFIDSDGKAHNLSGEDLNADKMQVKEDAGQTDLIEENAPQPEAQPESSSWTGEFIPDDYEPPQEETFIPPNVEGPTPTTPPEEQKIQPVQTGKGLEQEPLSFLQKRKNDKRRLFREKTRNAPPGVMSTLGSIEERLLKAANRLDEHGEVQAADKIDVLLQKLCEVKYVRKTSRLQTN